MASLQQTKGYEIVRNWLLRKDFYPFLFQEETWQHIIDGRSGLVNAPTGCGKTFSVFLGAVIQFINEHPDNYTTQKKNGLQLLWITPLRALAKDIGRAMEQVVEELQLPWQIGIRNGDTNTGERQKQKRNMPEVLIITPESLHLLLAQKGYPEVFKHLRTIAVDEWHELVGSKRGVLVELALSRIVNINPEAGNEKTNNTAQSVWGISATIGNLQQAKDILLSPLLRVAHHLHQSSNGVIVKAMLDKQIEIESVFPDEIEKYPWAGHLGLSLAEKIVPIIEESTTTLIFINTRGMSERWYQKLLDIAPQFAGRHCPSPWQHRAGTARMGRGSVACQKIESRCLYRKP